MEGLYPIIRRVRRSLWPVDVVFQGDSAGPVGERESVGTVNAVPPHSGPLPQGEGERSAATEEAKDNGSSAGNVDQSGLTAAATGAPEELRSNAEAVVKPPENKDQINQSGLTSAATGIKAAKGKRGGGAAS